MPDTENSAEARRERARQFYRNGTKYFTSPLNDEEMVNVDERSLLWPSTDPFEFAADFANSALAARTQEIVAKLRETGFNYEGWKAGKVLAELADEIECQYGSTK